MSDTGCLFCAAPDVAPLLDFGSQPLTNRWPVAAADAEATFPLRMAVCGRCGVTQLVAPPPPDEIRSRYAWLSYNEPEGHLDDVVERFLRLPGIDSAATVVGTTYKEDTTFDRLRRRGLHRTWRIDLARDFDVADPAAGLETLQQVLTPEAAERLAARHGRADLIFARHVIEHAQHPRSFAAALKRLVKPQGYVVFEVPDCTRSFDCGDYGMPWEEHVAYLTPPTYAAALGHLGFDVSSIARYEYSHEDSLVAFCRVGSGSIAAQNASAAELQPEIARARRYAADLPQARNAYRDYFRRFRAEQGPIAALGAGHLCAMFLNLLGVAEFVDFVVDDNPRKQGLHMPGSRLPILPSTALIERGVRLCLLSVNPEVERRVREKNHSFSDAGGRWMSMFAGRPQVSDS